MAVDPVAFIIDGVATGGSEIRSSMSSTLSPAGGVIGVGDLKVSQLGTPGMGVTVSTGSAWVPGTAAPTTQGQYWCQNPTATNVTITASAVQPRIDLISAQADDGGTNAFQLVCTAGTPAGSPVPPSAPANSITLAQVLVGASVTSILNANITDTRPRLGSQGINLWSYTSSVAGCNTTSGSAPGTTWATVAVPAFPFQTMQWVTAVALVSPNTTANCRPVIAVKRGSTQLTPYGSGAPTGGTLTFSQSLHTITDPALIAPSSALTYTAGLFAITTGNVGIGADDTVSSVVVWVAAA